MVKTSFPKHLDHEGKTHTHRQEHTKNNINYSLTDREVGLQNITQQLHTKHSRYNLWVSPATSFIVDPQMLVELSALLSGTSVPGLLKHTVM